MITYTQRKEQVIKLCGIHYKEPIVNTLVQWMSTADQKFQNATRRAWTQKEAHTNIEVDKQFYQLANDMHRVSEVRCKVSDGSNIVRPLTEIQSELEWNTLNTVPMKSNYPTHYFIKGSEQIGLYPIPSTDVVDGLIVSYEPRIRDMHIDDMKFKADVVENSPEITNPDQEGLMGGFKPWMEGTFCLHAVDTADGNWYRIQKYISPTKVRLDNNFLGQTGQQVELEMGQCPPYPEGYHEAPINYACHRFFSMRKDTESSAMYLTLFREALDEYRETYGSKTTGGVINAGRTKVPTLTDVFKSSVITEGH